MRARTKRRQAERAKRKAAGRDECADAQAEIDRLSGVACRLLRVCGAPPIERGVLVLRRASARPSVFALLYAKAVMHLDGDEIAIYGAPDLRQIQVAPGDPILAALDAAEEEPAAPIIILTAGDSISWYRAWVIPKNHGFGAVEVWARSFPQVNAAGGAA